MGLDRGCPQGVWKVEVQKEFGEWRSRSDLESGGP